MSSNFIKSALAVLAAALVVASCMDGNVDIEKMQRQGTKAVLAEPLPESISLLVGEEKQIVVHLKYYDPAYARISILSENNRIANGYEINDTIMSVTGISEGETFVTLSASGFADTVRVIVRDLDLNALTVEKTSVSPSFGERTRVALTVTPTEYPLKLIKAEFNSSECTAYVTEEDGRPYLIINPSSLGEYDVHVIGMERGKEKFRRTVHVTCNPILLDEVIFRVPVDSFLVKDTIPQLDGFMVNTLVAYKYRKVSGSVTPADFPDGILFISALWEPENVSVTEFSYSIKYDRDSTLHLKWDSSIENDGSEIPIPDPEKQKDLYYSLLAQGYSPQEIADIIAGMHKVETRKPTAAELQSGFIRDFSTDLLAWRISPENTGTAEIKVTVKYVDSVKNGKAHVSEKSATIRVSCKGREFLGGSSSEHFDDHYEIR